MRYTKVCQDLYLYIDGLAEGKTSLPLSVFGELQALNPALDFAEQTAAGRVLHINNYQADWYVLGFKIVDGEKIIMSISHRLLILANTNVAPVARRMENQPHISAIRDGFIVVLRPDCR